MRNDIRHIGTIDSIGKDSVKVRILQIAACGSCASAGTCGVPSGKVRIVDVRSKDNQRYTVGQQVVVVTSHATGLKALWWGFGLPFVIVLAVLAGTLKLTGNEVLAAGLSLAALIPYYIGLYYTRDKFKEKLSLRIDD